VGEGVQEEKQQAVKPLGVVTWRARGAMIGHLIRKKQPHQHEIPGKNS
jgi:hypothetical protein